MCCVLFFVLRVLFFCVASLCCEFCLMCFALRDHWRILLNQAE